MSEHWSGFHWLSLACLTNGVQMPRWIACDDAILNRRNPTMEQLWSKTVPKQRKQGQRQLAKPLTAKHRQSKR